MSIKAAVGLGLVIGFFIMGILMMQRSMPEAKEERIFNAIKVYAPYKLEKRLGGFTIINEQTGEKEKPTNAEVLLRFDELQQEWGRKHLKVVGNDVVVLGENNQTLVRIFIETTKELEFLKKFYDIQIER